MKIEEMTELLSSFANYIELYYPQSRERDNALMKLEEAVFWLIFLQEET